MKSIYLSGLLAAGSRLTPGLYFYLVAMVAVSSPAVAATAVTEQEAHAIGVDAYIYLYPLVTMDLTRKQSTNIEAGKEIAKGPMNMFVNVPEYPPATFRTVVRPNFDTLYSIAWLDLTKEPMIVSVPDTGGRYYLLPMLDMYSPHLVGELPARRRATFSLHRRAGTAKYRRE
jgi:hypothetical protein